MLTMMILRNTKNNRYHPIVFRESPLPGIPDPNLPVRSKSYGHHTEGFSTRDEAVIHCNDTAKQEGCRICIKDDFVWNGEGIPSMIVFFKEVGDELIPLMF